jgi:hypothetical protein
MDGPGNWICRPAPVQETSRDQRLVSSKQQQAPIERWALLYLLQDECPATLPNP